MSRYQQSSKSNPFESDEEEEDFVKVDKTGGYNPVSKSDSFTSRGVSSSYASNRSAVSPTNSASNRSTVSPTNSASNSYSAQRPNQSTARPPSSSGSYYEEDNPFNDKFEQLHMKIANSENTQLESTQRALASIYESEAMGTATAEELLRQGETLNNIENKADSMQQNMKVTQRHLNNIKSVFGGIKNWWAGDKGSAETKPVTNSSNSKLRSVLETTEKSKPDVSGFYDNDNDLDSKFMAGARKPSGGQYTMISPITRSAREEEIDSNLYLMGEGMSRLKGLALGLGDEIEKQNEQLDRINVKVEKTDSLLSHQNTQMKRILRK